MKSVMKKLILISFLFIFLLSNSFSQTQLLRVGNAMQYWFDTSPPELRITVGTEQINGKEYFKRKTLYYPWLNPDNYQLSFERIVGDSLYFILSSDSSDSLVFNFNWLPGMITKCDTQGNMIYYEQIENIKIETTFIPNDTVYYIKNWAVDLNTGDTLQMLPSQNKIFKKFGIFYLGMWGMMEGVKIDSTRYGTVYPFPEEIKFSSDSIYVPSTSDTGSVFILNNSDYEVRIDSIVSAGGFYGYRGWFTLSQSEFLFYLFRSLPDDWIDSLGVIISPHDSIRISFYEVDLCPICYSDVRDYFIDTLRFVFDFNYYQNYQYNFSHSVQISGEGHTSSIEQDNMNPDKFSLNQNYPNPFNPSTTIQYALCSRQFVVLKVYDLLGMEIATLINQEKQAGSYEIDFDASLLSSGIYFYQLRAGSLIQTKKMIILR